MTDPITSVVSAFLTKKFGVVFSGFIGAIISLKFVDGLSLKARAFNVFCGVSLAYYITEYVVDRFGVGAYRDAVACLIGLFGLSACAAVFKMFNEMDLWAAIKDAISLWRSK